LQSSLDNIKEEKLELNDKLMGLKQSHKGLEDQAIAARAKAKESHAILGQLEVRLRDTKNELQASHDRIMQLKQEDAQLSTQEDKAREEQRKLVQHHEQQAEHHRKKAQFHSEEATKLNAQNSKPLSVLDKAHVLMGTPKHPLRT